MSHAMNTWRNPPSQGSAGPGSVPRTIVLRTEIKRTAERAVFFDYGERKTGAYFVVYDDSWWCTVKAYDLMISWQHGRGIVVSFADNHVEYKNGLTRIMLTATDVGTGYGAGNPGCYPIVTGDGLFIVTWGMSRLLCTSRKKCEY